jgi:hypothetical protein
MKLEAKMKEVIGWSMFRDTLEVGLSVRRWMYSFSTEVQEPAKDGKED